MVNNTWAGRTFNIQRLNVSDEHRRELRDIFRERKLSGANGSFDLPNKIPTYKTPLNNEVGISPTSVAITNVQHGVDYEAKIAAIRNMTNSGRHIITTSDRNVIPALNQALTQKENAVRNFLTGRGGASATATVERAIENVIQTLIDANISKGIVAPDDYISIEKIIDAARHNMRLDISNNVLHTHNAEGEALARQHGFRPWESHRLFRDWIHYDSDFYFMEKEMVSILHNVAGNFLRDIDVEVPDFEAQWRDFFGGAKNFHTRWHGYSASASYNNPGMALKDISLGGWMLDVRISPPRGFSFFFSEINITKEIQDPNTNESVTLTIQKRIMFFNKQMMVREGQFDNGKFNLFDLWDRNISSDNFMLEFLRNFEMWRNVFDAPSEIPEVNPIWQSQFKGGNFAGAV